MSTVAADADATEMRDFLCLLREVCRLLVECGCSSNRVELLTTKLGASWGFEIESLAIPTGVWISVRKGDQALVELTRVRDWTVNLDRLAQINELVDSIDSHNITIKDARQRLKSLADLPPPYKPWITVMAGGGASAVLVYFYGGTSLEIALAFPAGALVEVLRKLVFVGETRRYLADFLCAAFVALYAVLCQRYFQVVDVPRLIVGGIVVLVPGLVFVNALHEVAQKNLVSGAAKALEAMVIAASLACGVIFILGFKLFFKL
jgi:uncharacterized membrane protein YjjP (DUF1212 family)